MGEHLRERIKLLAADWYPRPHLTTNHAVHSIATTSEVEWGFVVDPDATQQRIGHFPEEARLAPGSDGRRRPVPLSAYSQHSVWRGGL